MSGCRHIHHVTSVKGPDMEHDRTVPPSAAPTPASAAVPPSESRPHKSRFGIGRIVTWVLIAALLVLLFIEWRARTGYTQTMEALDARINGQELARLGDLDEVVSGSPSVTRHERPQGDVVEYEWWSLFRDYSIKLQLGSQDKNPVVLGVLFEDDEIKRPAVSGEGPPPGHEGTAPGPGGMGGPGGGPGMRPPGGGAGRQESADRPADSSPEGEEPEAGDSPQEAPVPEEAEEREQE